jgi:NAD(P)-dependent dehydrogenase (short-subunit alcohol dehydrogenase family)
MNSQVCAGRIIVVTGGSGVLGSCFVRRIAEHGGIAVAADINIPPNKLMAIESHSHGEGKIEKVSLDITDRGSICRLIEDLLSRYGRIDAVVNNAYPRSLNYGRRLEDVEYSDFCESIDTHLGGYFLVAQQFSRVFERQGGGVVINMSSIYGSMAPRFDVYDGTDMTMPVEYAAIKSGVEQ